MFKDLKLGTKISLGFAIPLLMIAAIVVGLFMVAGEVKSNATLAKEESVVFAGIARQMKLDVVQVQQWLTDISATRGLDGLDDGFDEAEATLSADLLRRGSIYTANPSNSLSFAFDLSSTSACSELSWESMVRQPSP